MNTRKPSPSMSLKGSCLCGALKWTFDGPLASATACNCTACRRYGTLWAYGYENDEIQIVGPSVAYKRNHQVLGFHFCPTCGCLSHWLATKPSENGKLRLAVNLRLAEDPQQIEALLIDHFDGFGAFEDLPRDGRRIKDMWF